MVNYKSKIYQIVNKFIEQNYWDGHEPSSFICDYPDMFLLIGKKDDAYKIIINPVLEKIRNAEECPLSIKVVKLDASRSLELFKSQTSIMPPDPTKLNIYIIEDFDEFVFQGKEGMEFENVLCSLMGTLQKSFVPNMQNKNSHILIISEKEPRTCLQYFFRKDVMLQMFL